jgi:hypothetical protein
MKKEINHVKSKEPHKRRVACCKKVYLRKRDPSLSFGLWSNHDEKKKLHNLKVLGCGQIWL